MLIHRHGVRSHEQDVVGDLVELALQPEAQAQGEVDDPLAGLVVGLEKLLD